MATWNAPSNPSAAGGSTGHAAVYLPCMNPHCKSYGHSHPNCRCWGNQGAFPMAEGGEVAQHCEGEHKVDCEYYAKGGDVPAGAIPVDEFKAAEAPSEEAPAGAIPIDQFQAEKPHPDAIPVDEFKPAEDKYGSNTQGAIATAEGAAKGVIGFVAPWAEKHLLGVDEKDIKGREEAWPIAHGAAEATAMVGSLMTGYGEAALAAKAARFVAPAIEEAHIAYKIGSAGVRGLIESGLLQTSDEASKYILDARDPVAPVGAALANITVSSLMGFAGGTIFGPVGQKAGKKLLEIGDGLLESKARSYLIGWGLSAAGSLEEVNPKLWDRLGPDIVSESLKAGQKDRDFVVDKLIKKGATWGAQLAISGVGIAHGAGASSTIEAAMSGAKGMVLAEKLGSTIEKWIGEPVSRGVNKLVVPAVLKALSIGDEQGLGQVIRHAKQIAKGSAAIASHADSLFSEGQQSVYNAVWSEREREKTKKMLEDGELNEQIQNAANQTNEAPQAFAKGGAVAPVADQTHNAIARVFPEQNVLLNTVKGRTFTYLNGLRPLKNAPKLPFDSSVVDPEKERQYNQAIDIANQPLSVFRHMKDGTLLPDHVKHLNSMYPELKRELDKSLTERIIKSQMGGKKPPYKIRQAMSLFMGTTLGSEMTPGSIQAAQAVFANKGQAQQAPPAPQKAKRGTNPLSKIDDDHWSATQAAQKRQSAER